MIRTLSKPKIKIFNYFFQLRFYFNKCVKKYSIYSILFDLLLINQNGSMMFVIECFISHI